MKRILSFFILSFFIHGLFSLAVAQNKRYAIRKVVIDPGHGGHDAGCLGSKSKEKDVALAISLKFGKLIEENLKDVKVIYTRKSDVFVELHERAEIANNNKADVFICIHCNSGPKSAYGTETFALGLHKSEDNLKVAQRENASILMENNYKTKYEGFDPKSPEAYIIFSLYQNAFIDQSLNLSSKIENQFKETEGRLNRGVKQAGFLVLWRTTMPSVLIETGFLTNREEEKYMISEEGQNKIALSIFNAFKQYKTEMETGKSAPVPKEKEKEKTKEPVGEIKSNASDSITAQKIEQPAVMDSVAIEVSKSKTKEEVKKEIIPNDTIRNISSNIIFRVQIATASTKKPLSKNSPVFKGMTDISTEKMADGILKYTVGNFIDFQEAAKYQTQMRTKGFKDAFVVIYNNEKRISQQEYIRLGIIKK